MLIVTRRIGEAVIIRDDIKVVILDVKGKQVRVGIEAPEDMIIDREEVSERRRSGNWEERK